MGTIVNKTELQDPTLEGHLGTGHLWCTTPLQPTMNDNATNYFFSDPLPPVTLLCPKLVS